MHCHDFLKNSGLMVFKDIQAQSSREISHGIILKTLQAASKLKNRVSRFHLAEIRAISVYKKWKNYTKASLNFKRELSLLWDQFFPMIFVQVCESAMKETRQHPKNESAFRKQKTSFQNSPLRKPTLKNLDEIPKEERKPIDLAVRIPNRNDGFKQRRKKSIAFERKFPLRNLREEFSSLYWGFVCSKFKESLGSWQTKLNGRDFLAKQKGVARNFLWLLENTKEKKTKKQTIREMEEKLRLPFNFIVNGGLDTPKNFKKDKTKHGSPKKPKGFKGFADSSTRIQRNGLDSVKEETSLSNESRSSSPKSIQTDESQDEEEERKEGMRPILFEAPGYKEVYEFAMKNLDLDNMVKEYISSTE